MGELQFSHPANKRQLAVKAELENIEIYSKHNIMRKTCRMYVPGYMKNMQSIVDTVQVVPNMLCNSSYQLAAIFCIILYTN